MLRHVCSFPSDNAEQRTAKYRHIKNRPSVWNTEERRELHLSASCNSPCRDNTANHKEMQGSFEANLLHGAENALPLSLLSKMSGLNERDVQRKIANERASGAVILSGGGGYYLPDDGEKGRLEAEAFVATTKAKALNTLLSLKSAQAFLDKLPGQEEIGAKNAESEKAPLGEI